MFFVYKMSHSWETSLVGMTVEVQWVIGYNSVKQCQKRNASKDAKKKRI